MTTKRRIYVACLAAYNSGRLHGEWIDTDGLDADDIQEEVNAMLKRSPCADAEEWAIHDHEGFGGLLGEYDSFERVAELSEALEEHGDALLAFLSAFGASADITKFRDAYQGEYDSGTAFAEQWAEDMGLIADSNPMYSYIDWAAYWNGDLRHSFTFEDGHVFNSDW